MATAVSQTFGRFTYGLLFSDIREDFGISSTMAGAMGSANLVAYIFGSWAVSRGVGRWGLDAVARLGLIGVTVGLVFLAWSPTAIVTAAALVLTGGAAAGVWVTAPALAAGMVDPNRRGAAMGIVGSGIGIGLMVASLLDTTIGGDDFRNVYRAELALAIVILIGVLATLTPRPPVASARMRGLDELRRVPHWIHITIEYTLFAFAMVLVMTFAVGYLEDDAGTSRDVANGVFLMIGAGTLVGGPTFGPMTDRIGRRPAQVAGFVIMIGSTLVIAAGEPVSALIAGFLFGISFTGGPTCVAARVSDHLSGDPFGAAYGFLTIAFGAGLAAGPQIGGLLEDATGSGLAALLVSAAAATLALATTLSERRLGPAT